MNPLTYFQTLLYLVCDVLLQYTNTQLFVVTLPSTILLPQHQTCNDQTLPSNFLLLGNKTVITLLRMRAS